MSVIKLRRHFDSEQHLTVFRLLQPSLRNGISNRIGRRDYGQSDRKNIVADSVIVNAAERFDCCTK